MKISLTVLASVMAAPVMAHGTHVAQSAGHNHIAALVAIAVAGLAALYGATRKKAA